MSDSLDIITKIYGLRVNVAVMRVNILFYLCIILNQIRPDFV